MIKWLLLVAIAVASVSASNILLLSPMSIFSHWMYLETIVNDLLIRGHRVTTISSYITRRKHENFTNVDIPALNLEQHFGSKNFYDGSYVGETSYISFYRKIGLLVTEAFLKNPKVTEFIVPQDKKFDLVITEQINAEALYLFAHKFNCPLVTISIKGPSAVIDRAMGLFTPLAHVPHEASTYFNSEMSFRERVYNAYISTYESFTRRFSYISAQNKLAKKYFGEAFQGEVPHVSTMEKRIALTLINSHDAIEISRPKMPSQVYMGGSHIRRPLALSQEFNGFLNNTETGFIYVSFGTFLKTESIPKEKYQEILEAFKILPYKIMWKISSDPPANLPPNVLARRWFPQSDLLGHPKMLLFITHGGWLSFQESIYRGVPMLFIPFMNDQYRNAAQAVKQGYGSILNFDDITKDNLANEVDKIIKTPEYKDKANQASKVFRDTFSQPMQEMMYWIEYVIRHNGAQHLRSPSVDLCWSKYAMIDVGFFFFAMFVLSFISTFMIIKFAIEKYRGREQRGKFKYY